ncbi:hypothetical protein [Kribbella qitaiheensis]|uniref:hypothetical protein n=1 Tax=Kribbella qitaiheensis TaxID=1544730 RepID=UPI001FE85E6A|nr:hypothetical protein [Kribbella qitaiheensis]
MSSSARRVELEVGLALAALGFLLGGLGACVAVLARDLDEPAGRLALLPSAFALGLLIIAFLGPILLRTGAITAVLRGGALVCALGAVLVAVAPSFITAVTGGLLIGLGGALLVLLAPLLLSGPTAAARLTKVNAVGSATGILAPLAIGGLDSLGPTGRLAMLLAVPAFLVLIVIAAPARAGQSLDSTPAGEGSPWLSAFRGWSRVVLAVAVEFCFVVWSVARLVDAGLAIAIAALLGSAFPIGMAVGRSIGPIHFRGWAPLVPARVAGTQRLPLGELVRLARTCRHRTAAGRPGRRAALPADHRRARRHAWHPAGPAGGLGCARLGDRDSRRADHPGRAGNGGRPQQGLPDHASAAARAVPDQPATTTGPPADRRTSSG